MTQQFPLPGRSLYRLWLCPPPGQSCEFQAKVVWPSPLVAPHTPALPLTFPASSGPQLDTRVHIPAVGFIQHKWGQGKVGPLRQWEESQLPPHRHLQSSDSVYSLRGKEKHWRGDNVVISSNACTLLTCDSYQCSLTMTGVRLHHTHTHRMPI